MSAIPEHGGQESFAGVSLPQYAGILAAETEGIPLDIALSTFDVSAAAWPEASQAWGRRIAQAAVHDEPLLAELDSALERARERFARRVPPLDEDIHRWLGFLEAWAAHPEPMALLRQLGLVEGDIFRLNALWGERLAADEQLRKQCGDKGAVPISLDEIRPEPRPFAPSPSPPPTRQDASLPAASSIPPMFAEEPGPQPSVTPASGPPSLPPLIHAALPELVLPRSPALPSLDVLSDDTVTAYGAGPGAFAWPFEPAQPAASEPALDLDKRLPLRAYARVCAELALFPARSEEVFARYGLTDRGRRAQLDQAWRARLAGDADTYAAWRDEYVAHQKRYQRDE